MMLEEVGCEEESARRMFPPALMKSRSIFGVKFGPSATLDQSTSHRSNMWLLPFDFVGSTTT